MTMGKDFSLARRTSAFTVRSWATLSGFETSGALLYGKSEPDMQKAYESLAGASDKFKVYRHAEVPEYLHYNSNPRAGDPVVIPTGPYPILGREPNVSGVERTLPRAAMRSIHIARPA